MDAGCWVGQRWLGCTDADCWVGQRWVGCMNADCMEQGMVLGQVQGGRARVCITCNRLFWNDVCDSIKLRSSSSLSFFRLLLPRPSPDLSKVNISLNHPNATYTLFGIEYCDPA